MVQEIFIVEDEADIISNLKPKFKSEKDFLLHSMNYRQVK